MSAGVDDDMGAYADAQRPDADEAVAALRALVDLMEMDELPVPDGIHPDHLGHTTVKVDNEFALAAWQDALDASTDVTEIGTCRGFRGAWAGHGYSVWRAL